jgi:hypothetical protein
VSVWQETWEIYFLGLLPEGWVIPHSKGWTMPGNARGLWKNDQVGNFEQFGQRIFNNLQAIFRPKLP